MPTERTRRRPVARRSAATATQPSVPRAFDLDLVSFNTHGAARDKTPEVHELVGAYLQNNPSMVACFQELFYDDQIAALDAALLGRRVSVASSNGVDVALGNGGVFGQRITPTSRVIGRSGLSIYTSLPMIAPARFMKFGSLPIPDVFAAKGVLAVRVSVDGVDVLVTTTHFCDFANDLVDGRGRRSNIADLATFVGNETAPLVIVGDFNIDARATAGLDPGLLDTLLATGGRGWIEAGTQNAAQRKLARPVPTFDDGSATLDLMLATAGGSISPALVSGSYRAKDAFASDHRLVRATLRFS
jgi:hypothetical protein